LLIGVALHKTLVDAAGGLVVLVGAGQWLYRRRGGAADGSREIRR
jgi:hypothetical protein